MTYKEVSLHKRLMKLKTYKRFKDKWKTDWTTNLRPFCQESCLQLWWEKVSYWWVSPPSWIRMRKRTSQSLNKQWHSMLEIRRIIHIFQTCCQWALAQLVPPPLITATWRVRLWVQNPLGHVWLPNKKKIKLASHNASTLKTDWQDF